MSIHFVILANYFLPLSFLAALLTPCKEISKSLLAIFIGFLFGYFAFFIAAQFLQTQNLVFNSNLIFALCVLSSCFLVLLKTKFNLILIAVLSFCFSVKYFTNSQNLTIVKATLLDEEAFVSLGFMILVFLFSLVFFLFLQKQSKIQTKLSFCFFFVLIFLEFLQTSAEILLVLMRENHIQTHSLLLSFVAKILYFSNYKNYIYLVFLLSLALLSLKSCPKKIQKKAFCDLDFRKNTQQAKFIKSCFYLVFVSVFLSMSIFLYFHIFYSKALKIDPPKEISPDKNNEFVFDISLLRDNKLHRFAYVSEEGKVIRFFLLNKREDKDSPVAVFDACMICGDMGYIKKGSELICIACNVRIFLPSVGKSGGCNPIPLKFSLKGDKIIIELKDLLQGSAYFNEIKEILVKDPISKEKLTNTKAPYSYSYKGITYYFQNIKNYEEFKKDPSIYVDSQAQFLIQRRGNVN